MNHRLARILAKLKIAYGTSNPFILCDYLNINLQYWNFHQRPLGKTAWMFGESFILLDQSLQGNSRRYFVCAHELGHFFDDKGFAGFYVANRHFKDRSEREADRFASNLMYALYIEENDHEPETVQELSAEYGVPIDGQDYLNS